VDQQVLLGGEVNPDPSFRLRLLATGVRGTLDPLADPWSDFATSALPAPTPRPQPYESARLVADGAVRFASATTISATGNLVWSGGTTPEARLLLPPQRTVNGTLVLEQGIGARTLVGLHADGTVARTWPAGPDNETGFAYLSLRVDRSLTRSTRVWISGGAAFVRETSTGRDEPIQNGAPGGELGITHTMRRSGLTSTGSVRLAPEIDRLTGAVRRAVSSTVTLAWSPAPRWTLRAEGTGSVTFPEREPRVVAAELRAQRTFENGVQLEWGARMRRQVDPRFVNGSFSEVGAFLAVDWTLARARPPRRPPTPAGAPAQ
jgi:hypothetical protein